MFCNKCGSKLTENAKTCNNCGAPSDHAEYCGGFWGLVGEEKAPVVPLTDAENPTKKRVNNGASSSGSTHVPSKQKRKKPIIWYVVCSILLLVLVVQTFRASYFSIQHENTQEKFSALNELYLEIKAENDMLTEAIDGIVNDLCQISDDVTDIKESLMPTESEEAEEKTIQDATKAETEPTSEDAAESESDPVSETIEEETTESTTESAETTESEVSHG